MERSTSAYVSEKVASSNEKSGRAVLLGLKSRFPKAKGSARKGFRVLSLCCLFIDIGEVA